MAKHDNRQPLRVMHHDAQAFGFAIRTTLTVLLMIAAWRFMVVRTMNDTFRQRLFEMRRSLFLLVADGRISPDEPAYRQLCSTINGLLKFAERVTLLRIVLIGRSTPLNTAAYVDRAGRSLAQIQDEEVRKTIAEYRDRVDGEIVLHVIRTSPELWLPLLVMMVGMMSMEAAKLAIRRWAKRHPPFSGLRSRCTTGSLLWFSRPVPVGALALRADARLLLRLRGLLVPRRWCCVFR